jgi:hypothetical protein
MRVAIGDLFEFKTPCGLAYTQYVYEDELLGSLARVLPGLYPSRPSLGDDLVSRTRFCAFVPIKPAVRTGHLVPVGRFTIPAEHVGPPTVRWSLGLDPFTHGWRLTNGDQDLGRRKQLTIEEQQFPEYELWDFGLLVQRVGSKWSWTHNYGPNPRPTPEPASPCYQLEPEEA